MKNFTFCTVLLLVTGVCIAAGHQVWQAGVVYNVGPFKPADTQTVSTATVTPPDAVATTRGLLDDVSPSMATAIAADREFGLMLGSDQEAAAAFVEQLAATSGLEITHSVERRVLTEIVPKLKATFYVVYLAHDRDQGKAMTAFFGQVSSEAYKLRRVLVAMPDKTTGA